jgi:predicted Zn-dependent peptidase
MDDLNAATVDDVAAFFKMYYAPNNAVVAISGDVNPAECLAKVRKYFESIPSQPKPPDATPTAKPRVDARASQTRSGASAGWGTSIEFARPARMRATAASGGGAPRGDK